VIRPPVPVGLVTYSVKPRGGAVHTVHLAEALHESGYPVRVIALGDPDVGFFRPVQAPVTIISAAVSLGPTASPASPSAAPPNWYGLLITLPPAGRAELTAVTTQAYNAQGAVDISVAGKTWALPMQLAPITQGAFTIMLPSKDQALQLQRVLSSPS